MARMHCPDCEMAVVVDPTGRCPEGHDLGNAGQRIEQRLGDPTPHPDEPQPWVGAISVPDAPPSLAAEPSQPEPSQPERPIRPVAFGVGESDLDDASIAEDSLNELHELHAYDTMFDAPQAPAPQAPASQPPAAQPPAASPSPAPAAQSQQDDAEPEPYVRRNVPAARSDEDMSAIAELTALLDSSEPPAAPQPAPADPGGSTDEHFATVSELPVRSPEPPVVAEDAAGDGSSVKPSSQAANGEDFDWGHFTARGRRKRFGR